MDPWVGKTPWSKIATHSSILAWRIPQTEEPGRLQFMGLQRVGLTEQLSTLDKTHSEQLCLEGTLGDGGTTRRLSKRLQS